MQKYENLFTLQPTTFIWYFYIQFVHQLAIVLISSVFANGTGDWGSIPSRVIPKTQKMVLDAALLSIQHYKVSIKVKWSNPGKVVAPLPTPRCSSY